MLLHVESAVVTPVCLMPILGEPFPAVHRVLEFRMAVVDGEVYFFFCLCGGEDDVLVTRLFASLDDAFADFQAWMAWLLAGEGIIPALGDLAAESMLRDWTPPTGVCQ